MMRRRDLITGAAASIAAGFPHSAVALTSGEKAILFGGSRTFGFYNFTGLNLAKWFTALAAQKAGTSNAKLMCVGDSTTAGEGSTNNGELSNAKSQGWPSQLAALLAGASGSSQLADNGVVQFGTSLASFNNQVSLGAGWQTLVTPPTAGDRYIQGSVVGSGAYALTFPNQIDTIEIYWARNNGTFTVDVDGGAVLATVNTAGTAGIGKTTVSGVALGLHTINIIKTVAPDVFIGGVVAYNSAIKEISIYNGGWCGSVAADWAVGDINFGAMNMLGIIAPNLTIIDLTINNWNAGTTISTWTGQLTTITNKAKISGDVIYVSGNPSNPSGHASLATQATYVAALKALAYTNGVPFINIWELWGGNWSVPNSKGWMASGSSGDLHPVQLGYSQITGAVNRGIQPGFRSAQ